MGTQTRTFGKLADKNFRQAGGQELLARVAGKPGEAPEAGTPEKMREERTARLLGALFLDPNLPHLNELMVRAKCLPRYLLPKGSRLKRLHI